MTVLFFHLKESIFYVFFLEVYRSRSDPVFIFSFFCLLLRFLLSPTSYPAPDWFMHPFQCVPILPLVPMLSRLASDEGFGNACA